MGMLVVGLTELPQLGSAQGMGAGEAAMMLSLLTVAAATGLTAALGPSSEMAVAGTVCLVSALVVRQAVPHDAQPLPKNAGRDAREEATRR